jgi:HEAT repeat protein
MSSLVLACALLLVSADPPEVDALMAQLDGEEPEARLLAMQSLGQIGPRARRAVPKLVELLGRQPLAERAAAAYALAEIDLEVAQGRSPLLPGGILPVLSEALKDPNEQTRLFAVSAVDRLGRDAQGLLPQLVLLVDDPGSLRVRAFAAGTVVRLDPGRVHQCVTTLKSALAANDLTIVRQAAIDLGRVGPRARGATPDLRPLLTHDDRATSQAAAFALADIDSVAAREGLEVLKKAIRGDNLNARRWAVRALGRMGPDAAETVPLLRDVLSDKDEDLRARSAAALGLIGSAARPAVPDLLQALKDRSPRVRAEAAYSLGRVGPGPGVTSGLLEALHDESEDVRRWAANSLGQLRPPDKEVIPALARVLGEDASPGARGQAAQALVRIGAAARAAIPDFLRTLEKDQDSAVRLQAAQALAALGPVPKDRVDALVACLEQEKDDGVRQQIVLTLGIMGPDAAPAVTPLLRLTQPDQNLFVRIQAVFTLGQIGAAARAATETLIRLLDEDEDVRISTYAAYALGRIGPEPHVAPALGTRLGDPRVEVQVAAATALGDLGPSAKSEVPRLLASAVSKELRLCRAAVEALGRIGPASPDVVTLLRDRLKDPSARVVSLEAVRALGRQGDEARAALPDLCNLLGGADRPLRLAVAEAVSRITPEVRDTAAVSVLEEARKPLQRQIDVESEADVKQQLKAAQTRLDQTLTFLKGQSSIYQVRSWLARNSWMLVAAGFYLLLLALALACFWWRPLWLLKVNEAIDRFTSLEVTSELVRFLPKGMKISLPVKYVLLVGFFHYRRRVLDAWVRRHLRPAYRNFSGTSRTVQERLVHVTIPVIRGQDQTILDLGPDQLRRTLARTRWCLLLWGAGGAGKTSLACRIARWAMQQMPAASMPPRRGWRGLAARVLGRARPARPRFGRLMLPILFERALPFPKEESGKEAARQDARTFRDLLENRLRALTGLTREIPEGLCEQLLQQGRVLVILDGLSEWDEAARERTLRALAAIPASALVITSRNRELLNNFPNQVSLRPCLATLGQLTAFTEAYLARTGAGSLFRKYELSAGCGDLVRLVGEGDVPALLARMNADLMAAAKKGAGAAAPQSVAELMARYLSFLNRNTTDPDLLDGTVQPDARAVAWASVEAQYRPSPVPPARATLALQGLSANNVSKRLAHLRTGMHLLRAEPNGDLAFNLDPLAETLAALHWLNTGAHPATTCRAFLDGARKTHEAPQAVGDFLLALLDTALAATPAPHFPAFFLPDLAQAFLEKRGLALREDDPASLPAVSAVPVLAWHCLNDTYRPTPLPYAMALAALTPLGSSAAAVLATLDGRLGIIRVFGTGTHKRVRFVHERLAEYLGALYLVQSNGTDQARWQAFFQGTVAPAGGAPASPTLLRATWACCLAATEAAPGTLAAFATGLLALTAAGSLASARTALGVAGTFVDSVVVDLGEALQDPRAEVRRESAEVLGRLGPDAAEARVVLASILQTDPDTGVRQAAAAALHKIGGPEGGNGDHAKARTECHAGTQLFSVTVWEGGLRVS